MIDETSLKKMISLLEGVLDGSVNPDDAVGAWPYRPSQDELAARALHMLEHYASDVDIHEKEPGYERDQRDRLNALLAQLKTQGG